MICLLVDDHLGRSKKDVKGLSSLIHVEAWDLVIKLSNSFKIRCL